MNVHAWARRRSALFLGFLIVVAACSGRVIPPQGASFGADSRHAGGASNVAVTLFLPSRGAHEKASAQPAAASVTVDGAQRALPLVGARSCVPSFGGRTCTLALELAPGDHVVRLDLAGANGPASAAVPVTVKAGEEKVVPFSAGGVPAQIALSPTTITFSPNLQIYPSPAPGYSAAVYVTALTSTGQTIVTSRYGRPINVRIYEPAAQPVTIASNTKTGNTNTIALRGPSQGQPLTLQYGGGAFAQPLSLVATANGMANAAALVVNGTVTPNAACTPAPAATGYYIPYVNSPATAYQALFNVPVRIGVHATPIPINLDTGSVGLAISTDVFERMMGMSPPPSPAPNGTPIPLPTNLPAGVSGPGSAGQITYTSDGLVEMGYYYTANLRFGAPGANNPTTVPMQILVVTQHGCNPLYLNGGSCPQPRAWGVANMGIGFDPLDLSTSLSPVQNPFLELRSMLAGQLPRRYIINNAGMTFGGTAAQLAGFNWVKLDASRSNPGDWNMAPMCVSFPGVTGSTYTCGQLLVDSGYQNMIMSIPLDQQIPGLYGYLGAHNAVQIIVPGANPAASPLPQATALNWTFEAPGSGTNPLPSPAPTYPAAVPNTITFGPINGPAFINTSQRILFQYDYAYDADCGAIGFRPASPAPPAPDVRRKR